MNGWGFGTYKQTAEEAFSAVSMAIRYGVRHFDTASLYKNEQAVQAAIEASGVPRGEFWVTTKIYHSDFAPDQLEAAIHRALQTFKGCIDLLLLHSYGGLEVYRRFVNITRPLKSLRNTGVSNYSVAQLEEAFAAGLPAPHCNQIEFSPLCPRWDLLQFCQAHDIQVVAHSMFGRNRWSVCPSAIRDLSQKYQVSDHLVVFQWVKSHGIVPLVSTSQECHLQQFLVDVSIPQEELSTLDCLSERFILFPQHFL